MILGGKSDDFRGDMRSTSVFPILMNGEKRMKEEKEERRKKGRRRKKEKRRRGKVGETR